MADDCKNMRSTSRSVPCLPVLGSVTKSSFFLSQTPVPKIANKTWVQGAPTPIATGSLSPNEQAVALLAGFASGRVTMEGESIKHLPDVPVKTISQTLSEVWGMPKWKPRPAIKSKIAKKKKNQRKQLPISWQRKNLALRFLILKSGLKI